MTTTGGAGPRPGGTWTGGPAVAGGVAVGGRFAGAAGALSAVFLLSHLPIVIGTSSGFPLLGGVQRVSYASVMLVLLVTARSTRLAVDGVRNTSDAVLGDPTDIGRVA